MGQKTNPIGNRLGIIRGWDSNWYGGRRFEDKLVEDDKIRKYLNARLAKVQININAVKRPEMDSVLVAQNIAKQIEGRIQYRRAIKNAITSTMRSGAEGIKVSIAGRIGGAEIARSEHFKEGRTPLHTLRADIDYANAEAHTTYGRIGIKVWICRGVIYGRPELVSTTVGGQQKDARPGMGGARRQEGGAPRRRQGNRNNNSK